MRRAYRLVNVFTQDSGRLTGNPLCVFEDGRGIADDVMQALALQFNLSETTFIFPSDEAHARVRIFTPSYEMPFAGHPTLGTAHVVRSLKSTGDQVNLLGIDNVVSDAAIKDKRTFAAFGITPTAMDTILPTYMYRYRKHGQFDRDNAPAPVL